MKIKLYISIILATFLFGCEDYLREEPKSEITSQYAETPEGAESVVKSLYAFNRDVSMSMMYTGAAGTDIWTMAVNQKWFRDMAWYIDERMVSSLENYNFWRALNVGVDRALFALENLEAVNMQEDKKNELAAEASALLAFWRYLLVETYGEGANFAEKATRGVVLNGNQVSIDVFYTDILNRIDFAIQYLPQPNVVKYGELNVGVAKAMKAKFLLALAGYDESIISKVDPSLTQNECLQQAEDLALEVINDYGYELVEDYSALWDWLNKTTRNNEVIWSVQFTDDNVYNSNVFNNKGNDLHYYWVAEMRIDTHTGELNVPHSNQHTLYYGKKQSYVMPTMYYIQSFGKYDQRLWGSFIDTWLRLEDDDPVKPPVVPKVSTDTVIYRSFFPMTEAERDQYASRGVVANGLNDIYDLQTGLPTVNGQKGFYTFRKYLDATREDARDRNGNKDFIFIRLAEMYLMAAECEVRLGRPGNAVPYIQAIRQRATMPGHEDELLDLNASDMTMDFILDEYGRELGGELWRFYLLKRTGTLLRRVQEHNPDIADKIKDYHINRPVPQQELDAVQNKDKFVQNPGY